jgi:hypothetical protein
MHPELINRIVTLVKKHGDRLVLADEQTGDAVVVLPLDAYERLVGVEVGRSPLVQQQPVQAQATAAQRPAQEAAQRRTQHEPPRDSQRSRGLTTEEVMAKVGEPLVQPLPTPAPAVMPAAPQPPVMAVAPQAAAASQPVPAAQDGRDDEERFYLEPIE